MSARPSNPCGDLQSLADRAVALGPEHGRTKELMGWAVCEIERLRAELETVTAARDRWHRKYEGACATIDTYSSDETCDGLEEAARDRFNEVLRIKPRDLWELQPEAVKETYREWAKSRGELKANACQCDPNPSIGGSPPCPVHDGESEDAS